MWILWALLGSVITAGFMEINRHFQQSGLAINYWRALFQLVVFAPLLFISDWPTDPWFYAVGVFGGLVVAGLDSYVFHIAAKHNGRVASMAAPMQAAFAFLAWMAIAPESFWALWERPLHFVAVLLGFMMLVSGAASVRKNPAGWATFRPMIFAGVIYALCLLARRLVITEDWVILHLFQVFLVHYAVSTVLLTLYGLIKGQFKAEGGVFRLTPRLGKAASLMALSSITGTMLLNYTVVVAPNPGYGPVIFLLSPIWLMVYHKLRGIDDSASPYAAALVVLGAVLVLFAAA